MPTSCYRTGVFRDGGVPKRGRTTRTDGDEFHTQRRGTRRGIGWAGFGPEALAQWRASRKRGAKRGHPENRDFVPARCYNGTIKMNGARPHEGNATTFNTLDLRWTKWPGLGATGFARRVPGMARGATRHRRRRRRFCASTLLQLHDKNERRAVARGQRGHAQHARPAVDQVIRLGRDGLCPSRPRDGTRRDPPPPPSAAPSTAWACSTTRPRTAACGRARPMGPRAARATCGTLDGPAWVRRALPVGPNWANGRGKGPCCGGVRRRGGGRARGSGRCGQNHLLWVCLIDCGRSKLYINMLWRCMHDCDTRIHVHDTLDSLHAAGLRRVGGMLLVVVSLVLLDALLAMCFVERLVGSARDARSSATMHSRTGTETALDGSPPRCSAPRSRRG